MTRHLRPPPDLQELVQRYGTYSAIPPEAWAEWDRAYDEYRAAMRAGELSERESK
jgi:hypothetical protein